MNNYDMTKALYSLWQKSVDLYQKGNRLPRSYFTDRETEMLTQWGLRVMDIYDYAEDYVTSQDPDFGTFLLINTERILYFQEVLCRRPSTHQLEGDDLPAKTAEVNGMEWLPRILVKARGKLEGTLCDDIMYGCGGDRRFLRNCGLHPVELLRKVRECSSDQEIIQWVEQRKKLASAQ